MQSDLTNIENHKNKDICNSMRHLSIRNFGPVKDVSLELGQVNVIIGMQSSGKSCVLKTACYCSWVEKRLELAQKVNGFSKGSSFIDIMADYYKMTGYVREDTYISYETNHLKFSYDHSQKKFEMKWKQGHWNYRKPKVSYVPADRNLVAAIPGWSSLSLDGNMLEFMSDWDRARHFVKREENLLNLGISYNYDSATNTDRLQVAGGVPLVLRESSSGVQSLLPMFVHLDYLTKGQYEDQVTKMSYEQREERKNLLSAIYSKLYKKKQEVTSLSEVVTIEGFDYGFSEKKHAKRFREIYNHFTQTDHSEVFLEEPEDNLFPPTQCQFVNWLVDAASIHNDLLFVATHSPYVLNQFIKLAPKGLTVFFTHPTEEDNCLYSVRQLTEHELHEIYDNGVDLFFNFELYI